jgi:hypothetical protein
VCMCEFVCMCWIVFLSKKTEKIEKTVFWRAED